jgi:hypothetical protein
VGRRRLRAGAALVPLAVRSGMFVPRPRAEENGPTAASNADRRSRRNGSEWEWGLRCTRHSLLGAPSGTPAGG